MIKNKLKIKFRSLPVYDKKYLKTKVRRYEDMIKTNLLGNGMPKENMHYACIACITVDSVMKMDKKYIFLFRRMKISNKENTNVKIYQH